MKNKYKIAYATGSRADYGIVRNYLSFLKNDIEIDLSILVTGTHVDEHFGNTVSIIESDGFKVDCKVNIDIDTNSNARILNSVSIAVKKFGQFFETNKYDLLIVLGDRYEMMAVVMAAAIQKIPILHLHGGEITYGNYDEFIRHCITKMSRFHFASTEVYRKRIIQLGENPNNVYNMGALGAENCRNINCDNVLCDVKILQTKSYIVVVFHPETMTNIDLGEQVDVVIRALKVKSKHYDIVLIGTNADTNANVIKQKWLDFAKQKNVKYFENLNSDSYLYLVKNAVCLVGNSSSGIIEAPSLGVYSINIGDRQKGRVHGDSVIDVLCNEKIIIQAIDEVIGRAQNKIDFFNPYFQENVAKRCYETTKEIVLMDNTVAKEFYDLK